MNIAIAQIIPGDLNKQFESCLEVAHNTGSDLLVFPTQVFQTPKLIAMGSEAFEEVLNTVARLMIDNFDDPIHMIFPYLDYMGCTILIHAYKDQIVFYSHKDIDV